MVRKIALDLLDKEVALSFLEYEAASGLLRWKRRDREHFSSIRHWKIWNARYAGKVAGTRSGRSYVMVRFQIDGAQLSIGAHRIVWLFETGEWPSQQIDHVDGNPQNNHFSNLRHVSVLGNSRNKKRPANRNKRGACGVTWFTATAQWMARIGVADKSVYLGLFDNFDDALAARREAERKYGFHPNHGRAA